MILKFWAKQAELVQRKIDAEIVDGSGIQRIFRSMLWYWNTLSMRRQAKQLAHIVLINTGLKVI
jgi:hypothetical protein